jgi:transposase
MGEKATRVVGQAITQLVAASLPNATTLIIGSDGPSGAAKLPFAIDHFGSNLAIGIRRLSATLKVPTFDGHLNKGNTDLRRCSMEYAPRRKLTREFKLEAVRQVALSEKPKAQLARELGVRVGQLRTWRLEFEKEAVTGIAKPDRSAAEDLEQLRRENAKLKMEIEILKKAAIYFAREAK